MNILNAVRGQPLARKTLALALSLLAALCTLHARTALPDTQPGTAPASVSEAAPDLTPLTSATSVPAPSDDGAGTLGASALQPGVSSILARLSPAIIYVPPVVTDPVDLAILDARKAMQANNLAAFDTAAALVPRGHALSSYLDYWRIRIRLAASDPTDAEYLAVSADARAYLKQFPRTLTADLLLEQSLEDTEGNSGLRRRPTLGDIDDPEPLVREEVYELTQVVLTDVVPSEDHLRCAVLPTVGCEGRGQSLDHGTGAEVTTSDADTHDVVTALL